MESPHARKIADEIATLEHTRDTVGDDRVAAMVSEKISQLREIMEKKETEHRENQARMAAYETFRREGWIIIRSKYAGRCKVSGIRWLPGATIYWNKHTREARAVGPDEEAIHNCTNAFKLRG